MADDKRGRDKQAHDAERRQQDRRIATELARRDDPEPPVDATPLGALEDALDELAFPATGREVVAAIGDREIESAAGRVRVADLVPATDAETFDSPAALRVQVERPPVAAAMAWVVEASATRQHVAFGWTQRKAYEKTFEELDALDAADGIDTVTDWILTRLRETDTLPSSRAVRREAATFCRANGYAVRVDEWLGI